MGKLVLVTGGARSGKSSFAEEMAGKFGDNVLYIATSIPFDDEMRDRIQKHRERRPSCWETLEAYRDMDVKLTDRLGGKDAVLLDCVTIMVTNLMFEKKMDWDNVNPDEINEIEGFTGLEIEKLISVIRNDKVPFVIVTNEVGMGVVPEYPSGRAFRDIAGRVNQRLAREADEVYLCVSGIPVKIK